MEYKIKLNQTPTMKKVIYTVEHRYLVAQLKKARLEEKMEQAEVAKILGKTQSFVSKIENGQRKIDVIQLKEFAKIYKKKLEFFIK